VIGYSEFVLDTLQPDDPLRDDLEEIKRAGERGRVLTRQLLAFSRGQPLAPVVLDVNDIVAELEPLLLRLIREDIRLDIGLHADVARVLGDRGQLEQVIVNLVVNASDAMPSGGVLAIATAEVELGAEYFQLHRVADRAPGRYLLMEVTDSGIGMDAETISHVFEPFYTTKGEGQGTGLGLATVYGIVRQSGGFLWVYSEPGLGTTFKVHLPAVVAPVDGEDREPAAPQDAPARLLLPGRTALLVEDDDMVRTLVRQMLEQYGLEIIEAGDGDQALALSQASDRDAIDLLVTDTVLPGVGGVELAARVQARHPALVTLIMSGYSETLATEGVPLAKGAAFIAKPFSPTDFSAKLDSLFTAALQR
jgi:CheY-like chemotaxis protein